MARAAYGRLAPLGVAHLDFGRSVELSASSISGTSETSTLPAALVETQRQHVDMLRVTDLHVRTCASALQLPESAVRRMVEEACVCVSPSTTTLDGEETTWPLAVPLLQKLRSFAWGFWRPAA